MSFKPSGTTLNDAAGRIWPVGLVFDTCDLYPTDIFLDRIQNAVNMNRLSGGRTSINEQPKSFSLHRDAHDETPPPDPKEPEHSLDLDLDRIQRKWACEELYWVND